MTGLSSDELEAAHSDLLVDQATFSSLTIDELLAAEALPTRTTAALRERYTLG